MQRMERHASHGGYQEVWQHHASSLDCTMKFAVYLPRAALRGEPCPVLYWLSGLTCTEQNFITKAAAQRWADAQGLIVVAPDTSPRGAAVADDPAYDLGQGAGFYVNATQPPWAPHYRMYDYVVQELPALVEAHFPASAARAISGHSMGGHGALVAALRNPGRYRSVSAFAPIVAPSQVPWGEKAFTAYLGSDRASWREYDAVALLQSGASLPPALVDQGGDDEFLETQLQPQRLRQACEAAGQALQWHVRPGFDHSYYFIASFIEAHLAFHAQHLK